MRQDRDLGRFKKKDIARNAGDYSYEPLYQNLAGGSLKIDHKRTAHLFVKLISSAGLHPLVKKIMVMRLLGVRPNFIPMTITGVAISLGLRKYEVKKFEKEGIDHVSQFMKRVSIEEAKNQFNQNSRMSRDLGTDLSNPDIQADSKEDEDGS